MNLEKEKSPTDLLKLLLNKVYEEREDIGKELHSSKVYLNEASKIIDRLAQRLEGNKNDLDILDSQKQLTTQFLNEFSELRFKIYPAYLSLSGILICIKKYIREYQKTYPINIDLDYDTLQENCCGEILDIRIYKSCIEIIDCMFLNKVKTLEIKINCDGKNFEFEVFSRSKTSSSIKVDLNEKHDLIKANILWAGGRILEETNWKNRFKVIFKIIESN